MNPALPRITAGMKQVFSFAASALALSLCLAAPILRAADMPANGSNAPDFALQSQEGKNVSLKDFRGQWVVLYFYPKDMTQGCTIEAHNFQRDLDQYTAKKAAIVGVSADYHRFSPAVLHQGKPDLQAARRSRQGSDSAYGRWRPTAWWPRAIHS